MRWWEYLLFALGSLCLSAISVVFWMINPFTMALVYLAAPVVRLLHYDPPIGGFSGLGSVMTISLLWPLTLAPLHWLNFRVLRWNGWSYVGLLLLANALTAFVVLYVNASPLNE